MLTNKVVLITGASSGIGESAALLFAKEGAKLILCARNKDKLDALSQKIISEYNTEVYTHKLDVTKLLDVNSFVDSLPEKFQNIDVLLNNAGLAAGLDNIQNGDINDWEAMIDTNVKGLLYLTRAVTPLMINRNSGHVINIGSVAGHEVYPKGAVYCATKAAVNSISKGMRMDLTGTNIRVTSIDPGAVETNFSNVRFKGDAERSSKVYEGFDPLTANDIADAILYCAKLPAHVNISEMHIMPTAQASATIVSRAKN